MQQLYTARRDYGRLPGRERTGEYSRSIAICIYRIVQEGLRNVAKHSGTTQLQISLTGKDDSIHLSIKDHGAGFDPKEIEKKLGLGLVSMQERVRLIQGEISIESRPGKGTVINVQAPLSLNNS